MKKTGVCVCVCFGEGGEFEGEMLKMESTGLEGCG